MKHKVYLTNGTDIIVYDLVKEVDYYSGFTDKKLTKPIIITPKEMHVYEGIK